MDGESEAGSYLLERRNAGSRSEAMLRLSALSFVVKRGDGRRHYEHGFCDNEGFVSRLLDIARHVWKKAGTVLKELDHRYRRF